MAAIVPAIDIFPEIKYAIKNVALLPVIRQLIVFTKLRRVVSLTLVPALDEFL